MRRRFSLVALAAVTFVESPLLFGAQTPSGSPSAGSKTGPRWELEHPSYDFGSVWAGVQVEYAFVVKNKGDAVLRILEAKPRCACSVAENYTREIQPGKEGYIPFILKTGAKNGRVAEWLDIKTNDPVNPYMKVELRGIVKRLVSMEVISDINAEPGSQAFEEIKYQGANFGRIKADQRVQRVIRLRNTTGSPLHLELLSVSPAGAQFRAELRETVKDEEYELTVEGKPPFAVGSTQANVVLKTNRDDYDTHLIGIFTYVPPRVEVIPDRLVVDPRFPPQSIRSIRINNNGSKHFEITSISASNPDIELRLLPPNPTLPTTREVKVKLPLGQYRPPPYGDMIRIETDDPEHPTIDLFVLPGIDAKPEPRPADVPLEFFPGRMN